MSSETSERVQRAEENVRLEKAKSVPRVTRAKSSGGSGFFSIITKEAEEFGAGLLEPSPTSEVKPIEKAYGEANKETGRQLEEHVPGAKTVKHVADVTEAGVEAAGHIAGDIGKLTEVKTWIRIGKVLAGAIIVIFGLWLLAKAIMGGSGPGSAVKKAASAPIKYAGEKRAVSKALGKSEAERRARLAEHSEREAVTTRHAQKREAARRATVRARKKGNG